MNKNDVKEKAIDNTKKYSKKKFNQNLNNIKYKLTKDFIFNSGTATMVNIILMVLFVYTWYNKEFMLKKYSPPPLSENIRNYYLKNGIPIEEKKKGFFSGKTWYFIKNSLIIGLFITYHIFYTANLSAIKCAGSKQWVPSIIIVGVNFLLYIGLIILVVDKLPGFFQPFSNIIGYTIIISPLLREIVKSLFKLFSFVNYIPLKRSLMRIIKSKTKKINEKIFDIRDILKTLLLNPKDGGDIIDKILEDPAIFIENLSPSNLDKVIKKLKKDKIKIIKTKEDWEKEIQDNWNEEDKLLFEDKNNNIVDTLRQTLKFRDSFSYFIWLGISVILFMSSNKTHITNLSICNVDKTISQEYEKLENKAKTEIAESNEKIKSELNKTKKDIEKDL